MISLITGGSASGKSACAEQLAVMCGHPRYYIATMEPSGEEARRRIEKHRALREGKGFVTIECAHHLDRIVFPDTCGTAQAFVVLLECVTNLVANEQFTVGGTDDEIVHRVMTGITHLSKHAAALILVTGEVFSEEAFYGTDTKRYLQLLGRMNQELAALADEVVEVVYGIPVRLKPADGGMGRQVSKQISKQVLKQIPKDTEEDANG